jgi:hypothetical protein
MSDAATAVTAAATPTVSTSRSAWHNPGGFSFRDLLDIINPLQHLPIISSIYRYVTGDRPGEAAQIAGDALYGGPIGVAVSLASAMTEDAQGHGLGEQALAAMFGPSSKDTAVASAATPPAAAPTAVNKAAQPATTAPAKLAAAVAAANPAAPAGATRAPMPLYGGVALPQTPLGHNEAAENFLAHNAALQREISAGQHAPTTALVPLTLPAGTLPAGRALNLPAPTAPTAATAASATPAQPPVAGAPLDVSQKMLDALDKYMKLEQERKAATPQVDLAL